MKEKLSIREYIKQIESQIEKEFHECPSICIEEQVKKYDSECKNIIDKELDNYFVLLDLGISVVIEIHKICKENAIADKNKFAYASLTSKMISQLISIRKLLYSGLMDGVKCLVRPFQETTEIFYSCMIDHEFVSKYGEVDKLYDNNKFWRENVNGNKLDKYMHKVFDTLEFPREAKKILFFQKR